VAAAALYYFNKSMDELSVPEVAYLAALPKGPNNYHPVKNRDKATERRNYVIDEMIDNDWITDDQGTLGKATPLMTATRESDEVRAPYFAEEIRRELATRYGADVLYRSGLSVRSTIDPHLQTIAEESLRRGLMAYDMKQGYRGPVMHVDLSDDANGYNALGNIKRPPGMLPAWRFAVVREMGPQKTVISFDDKTKGTIAFETMKWARSINAKEQEQVTSGDPIHPNQVFKSGDMIIVEPDTTDKPGAYLLRQIPKIEGAIVAMDPHTGRVLAMQGGWSFAESEFNRATQAKRQPGSSFKPFIYLAALDHGFTPSSLVLDGPITYTDALGRTWQPENYSKEYYGPSTLRVGVEKSRNLMTVRLADRLGMDMIVDYAKKFGINDNMQPHLANALGSTETTVLQMTSAYGMLVNGGKKITPHFIDRIQNRRGETVFKMDNRICDTCGPKIRFDQQSVPTLPDTREQIEDARTAYQMVSILEGVVQRGTATKLKDLGRPVAGKTGTTNESRDVWFVGFTPDLVAGVFVGFDQPQSLGDKETGGSLAVPIFGDFMRGALADTPPVPFRVPAGMRQVMVDANSGRRANFGDPRAIWESYIEGTEPSDQGTPADIVGAAASSQPTNQIGNTQYVDPAPYTPPPQVETTPSPFSDPNDTSTGTPAPADTEGIY